jgi:hypothetical protein
MVLIAGAVAVWPAQALAISNTPSSPGKVTPVIESGNPTDCGIPGTTVLQAGPGSGTVTDGKATITVTSDGPVFSFNATTLPTGQKILGVVAKGGSSGANLYLYTPGGVTTDGNLHPPPTGNGDQFAGISHILFCYGTPASTPPGTTPPGTTPPGTTPPGSTPTKPPTTTTPSSPTTGVKGTTKHKKKHKKHVKAKSISRPPRVSSGFTG